MVYIKNSLDSLSLEELVFLKNATDEIKQLSEDKSSTFKFEDYNRYIFATDINNNIEGILVYYETQEEQHFISKIFTVAKYRRTGVGLRLIDKLTEFSQGVQLICGIVPSNDTSIEFFTRIGFTKYTIVMQAKDLS